MSGLSFGFKSNLRLDHVRKHIEAASPKAVEKALNRLKEASMQQVPRDTGALAESCEVVVSGREGSVGYGTEYAVIQHERTDFAHPNGGNAKYLENPMNDQGVRTGMLRDMAEAMRF